MEGNVGTPALRGPRSAATIAITLLAIGVWSPPALARDTSEALGQSADVVVDQGGVLDLEDDMTLEIAGNSYEGSVPLQILQESGIDLTEVPVSKYETVTVSREAHLPASTSALLGIAAAEKCRTVTFSNGHNNLVGQWLTRVKTVVYFCYNGSKITIQPTASVSASARYGWKVDIIDGVYYGFCTSANRAYQAGGRAVFSFVGTGGFAPISRNAAGKVYYDGSYGQNQYC